MTDLSATSCLVVQGNNDGKGNLKPSRKSRVVDTYAVQSRIKYTNMFGLEELAS